MTLQPTGPDDEATRRAAGYLAQALNELQQAADTRSGEMASRAALQELAQRIERQLAEEKEQRLLLASQLTGLASSLDRLVTHLHGLSDLMADLLERLAEPTPINTPTPAPAEPTEPSFLPGGEGLSLLLSAVPGFQALMDIQKALMAIEKVSGVSVERFQEGDSRLLLHLSAPITAGKLASALRDATGLAFVVEESRPELSRLRLKIVPAA
ncbi:MAG: hypothetical protein GEU75_11035 [Dehalococcoidia bacterium]|nr:hypothetical protein [Dehalococcoidia bacterium]